MRGPRHLQSYIPSEIASLEEEAEIELAWQREVRRRIQELDAGAVQALPGEDVLGELDEIVK